MHHCTLLHAKRSTHTAINMLTNRNITFMPAITSTSSRMHGEFLRPSLLLQADHICRLGASRLEVENQVAGASGVLQVVEDLNSVSADSRRSGWSRQRAASAAAVGPGTRACQCPGRRSHGVTCQAQCSG